MTWRVCARLAVIGATSILAGCIEEPMGPPPVTGATYRAMADAELQTIGAPGPADRPFGEALVTYSHQVHAIHAFAGKRADAPIGWATLALAAALESMPAAAAEPALRQAAAAMRANQESFERGEVSSAEPETEVTKRSLAIAATALLDLAESAYRDVPGIAAEARAFAGAVGSIDSARVPPDRAGVLGALIRAEHVLAAMYAVNVAPPLEGSGPRSSGTPSSSRDTRARAPR